MSQLLINKIDITILSGVLGGRKDVLKLPKCQIIVWYSLQSVEKPLRSKCLTNQITKDLPTKFTSNIQIRVWCLYKSINMFK